MAYLSKIATANNKKPIPLLNLSISCISARSGPQIFSIKGEFIYLFSSFLITGSCNSSANSLFEIFSFLAPFPEGFLSKNYKLSKQNPCIFSNINHTSRGQVLLQFFLLLFEITRSAQIIFRQSPCRSVPEPGGAQGPQLPCPAPGQLWASEDPAVARRHFLDRRRR